MRQSWRVVEFAAIFSLSVALMFPGQWLGSGDGAPPAGKGPASPGAPALPGKTLDFPYDGSDVKDPTRAYSARIFLHDRALAHRGKLPLVVFLHGLNRELIPHRWMGGGNEGDVRRIVSDLIESGALPPVILAAPGSVMKEAVSFGSSFPALDFDQLVELVTARLDGVAEVDLSRIVVVGHSGAGCSQKGGILAATRSKRRPLAIASIDTCMAGSLAESLGRAHPETHVVVTWQTASWDRNFKLFETVFKKEVAAHPASAAVLRELDALPPLPKAHDATVRQTFEKWLPRLVTRP